jgi:hypothetical protein
MIVTLALRYFVLYVAEDRVRGRKHRKFRELEYTNIT